MQTSHPPLSLEVALYQEDYQKDEDTSIKKDQDQDPSIPSFLFYLGKFELSITIGYLIHQLPYHDPSYPKYFTHILCNELHL